MPTYHFRVETNIHGPCLFTAKDMPDLFEKILVWQGASMPARINIEFLRQAEVVDEEGAPRVL